MNIKTKTQAIKLFGSIERLAIGLDITRQTLWLWPEKLKNQQKNQILGAAINEGYLKCRITKK